MKSTILGLSTALALVMSAGAASAESSISILHFNDFHARFESINKYDSTCSEKDEAENKCFGGIARLKTIIDERRDGLNKEEQENLLLMAGDAFQGTLFYNKYLGRATASFYNKMGIDAFALGNHEFDNGPQVIRDFLDGTQFPVLGGNVDASKEPLLSGRIPSHIVVEKGGKKYGIIGVVTTDTAEIANPGKNVSFVNTKEYLSKAVPHLIAQGINRIIVLSHVGLEEDLELARTVPGIDVIIGGHSHTLMSNTNPKASTPYPDIVRGPGQKLVAVAQAYAYSKYLGELKVSFDDFGNVLSATGEPHLIDANVKPDEVFAAKLKGLAEPLNEEKAIVVATTDTTIDGDRKSCRAVECEMGNLVADAMLDRARDQGISIAIQNGGGLRASIDKGEITKGEVLTVLPFQNTMATFQLKGADVIAALENGVSQVENGKGRFPQVAGIRYAWDKSAEPMKGRIKQVQVMKNGDWANIDPEAVYGVVSNNFMRAGGDGYKVFASNGMNAYDYGPGVEEVVIEYLQKNGPYKAYLDGRIIEGSTFGDAMMKKDDASMAKKSDEEAGEKMAKKDDEAMMKKDEGSMAAGDYVVKAGDSLWSIAKSHYGDANMWTKIEKANGVENVRDLKIGQSLKLPK